MKQLLLITGFLTLQLATLPSLHKHQHKHIHSHFALKRPVKSVQVIDVAPVTTVMAVVDTTNTEPTTTVYVEPPTTETPAPTQNISGDPVPECIVQRESGGDWTAQNPVSTASGRFQILDTTWVNTNAGRNSGYTHAASAPPAIQVQVAAELVATQGLAPWGGGC